MQPFFRFHICCAHELCEEDRHNFDPKINNENLEKSIKTVLDMYADTKHLKGKNSGRSLMEYYLKALYIKQPVRLFRILSKT